MKLIMLHRSFGFRNAFSLALSLLGLEALGLMLFRNDTAMGWVVSLFSLVITGCVNCALCCWRARRAVSLRRHWVLYAASTVLSVIALVLRGWVYLHSLFTGQSIPSQIDYTDLLMVLNYVPTVILLSLPSGRPYLRPFFWIDTVQTVIIAYLVFVKLFAVIPFTYTELHPIAGDTLLAFYNIVNVALTSILTLRFFAAVTEDEKRFYRVFCWFMWVDTILIALYNMMAGQLPYASYYELVGVAPNMFLTILVWNLPYEGTDTAKVKSANSLADLLNIVSPELFTVSLLVLSIDAARHYFFFGMSTLAATFLLHSVRNTVLQKNYERAQRSLQQASDRLEELSMTDSLTGVPNRRYFDQALETELACAARGNYPLSLLMIDIDYFKALNDRDGHQAGDQCLVMIAQALRSALPRRSDLFARYGGEEFSAILPNTDQGGAHIVAANMQQSIGKLRIENQTTIGRYATISIGIAIFSASHGCSAQLLLQASDRALYSAKEKGRNQIGLNVSDMAPSP